jgi:AraC-like DNA-binding protein
MDGFPFVLPFIRWADVAVIRPGSPTSLRRLYDHELVYVLGGRGRITIERACYDVQPDQIFLIPPRVWHSFVADESSELPLLGVHFDWEVHPDTLAFPLFRPADEPVDEGRFRPFRPVPAWQWSAQPFLDLKGRPRARRLLEEIVAEHNAPGAFAREALGAALALLLATLAREAQVLACLQSHEAIGADALRRVEKARRFLEEPQVLAIEEVAQRVGWSGDHLRKMLRAAGFDTPAQIQMAARMKRARELLRDGILPVAQVGRECGFEDASHFARAFKSDSGLTPRQFLSMSQKI